VTLGVRKALTHLNLICSHLAKRLKSEGHYIVACDWKRNEHMPVRGDFERMWFTPTECRHATVGKVNFALVGFMMVHLTLNCFEYCRKMFSVTNSSLLT